MLRAVLFDLDGTLVDSRGLIARCLRETLVEYGYELPVESIARALGPSTAGVVEALTGAGAAEVEQIVEAFGRRYAGRRDEIEVYPGADALLDRLSGEGIGLALVTNTPEAEARAVLRRRGWTTKFALVLAGDSGAGRKPSPEPALQALRVLGSRGEEAMFIGDTAADMRCAFDAGVATRVLVGGGRHGPVPEELPTHVVADLVEARALLDRLLQPAASADPAGGRQA